MARLLLLVAMPPLLVAGAWSAKAASCPADANVASHALWSSGSLSRGKTVTGKHPCGRMIQCTGGSDRTSANRICKWL
jgi:hypothetical protein